ncbi:unnamed protein product, partial [Symbiodinium sp. CCMP2592]
DDASEYYSRSADGRVWGKKKLQETAEYPDKFLIEDAWFALAITNVARVFSVSASLRADWATALLKLPEAEPEQAYPHGSMVFFE